jgi:hypothetical protein
VETIPSQNEIGSVDPKADHFPTLRVHWPALVLAIAIGIICVTPYLYFTLHAPGFAGVQMMGSDAEDHYTARINQVYEGYASLGNTYLPQKNTPYLQPGLGENIVANTGMLLSISAPEVNVLSKFIFSLIISLLVYILAYALFKSRAAALLGSAFVVLGDSLISGPTAWMALLHGSSVNNAFLTYDRPINPEISNILLFGALICIYFAFFNDRRPRWYEFVICALLTGSSLYVSPFVFTFLVALQVLCFIRFLWHRDFRKALSIVAVGTVTAVVMIPFLMNYLALRASTSYADTMMRSGVVSSHALIVGYWIPIVLILVGFCLPQRYRNRARPFFILSMAALIILLNQQIVTGSIIQPGHYHWYITTPLVEILLGMYAALMCQLALKKRALRYGGYAACLAILIYNGMSTQVASCAQAYTGAVAVQRYAPVFDYLNRLQNRQYIWADKYISSYIPIYTDDDTANNRQTGNYLVPRSYFEQTVIIDYRLRGISPKDALAAMQKERGDISSIIYSLYWRDHAGSFEAIPDPIISSLAQEYINGYHRPLKSLLTDLGIHMIVWDRATDMDWNIASLPFVNRVFTSGTIDVYEIK